MDEQVRERAGSKINYQGAEYMHPNLPGIVFEVIEQTGLRDTAVPGTQDQRDDFVTLAFKRLLKLRPKERYKAIPEIEFPVQIAILHERYLRIQPQWSALWDIGGTEPGKMDPGPKKGSAAAASPE